MNYIKQREGERIHRREDEMNYIKQRENSPEIGRNELHQRKRERESEFTGDRTK